MYELCFKMKIFYNMSMNQQYSITNVKNQFIKLTIEYKNIRDNTRKYMTILIGIQS